MGHDSLYLKYQKRFSRSEIGKVENHLWSRYVESCHKKHAHGNGGLCRPVQIELEKSFRIVFQRGKETGNNDCSRDRGTSLDEIRTVDESGNVEHDMKNNGTKVTKVESSVVYATIDAKFTLEYVNND